ncbi:MAG: hypothetical protein WAN51_03080 [Alphaproteobacteria bacterium]
MVRIGRIIVGELGTRLAITGASSGWSSPALHWNALLDDPSTLKPRIVAIYAGLITANVAAWLWALAEFRERPLLLGTALRAYIFRRVTQSIPTASRRSTTSPAS